MEDEAETHKLVARWFWWMALFATKLCCRMTNTARRGCALRELNGEPQRADPARTIPLVRTPPGERPTFSLGWSPFASGGKRVPLEKKAYARKSACDFWCRRQTLPLLHAVQRSVCSAAVY